MTRQARFRKALRARGLCGCGRKPVKAKRCVRCYNDHAAYMRAYMARKRAEAKAERVRQNKSKP